MKETLSMLPERQRYESQRSIVKRGLRKTFWSVDTYA